MDQSRGVRYGSSLPLPTVMHSRQILRTLTRTPRRRFHTSQRVSERQAFDPTAVERAQDDVDVCIVGGGPAGLSAAIRLKQLEQEKGREIRVVVLEKGSEVGSYKTQSLGLF